MYHFLEVLEGHLGETENQAMVRRNSSARGIPTDATVSLEFLPVWKEFCDRALEERRRHPEVPVRTVGLRTGNRRRPEQRASHREGAEFLDKGVNSAWARSPLW